VRRALLPLLAALAALAGGCQESGFDESKETSKPLKVQHALGESKVPGQAEQPLTLTVDTLDDALALGVRPARAAVPGAKLPAYLRSAGRGVSLMLPATQADLPAIEAVHPDLILGTARQGGLYDDLSRIASSVMIDGSGSQWKLDLRLAGEALGRTNDAEALLTDYDRRVASVRRALDGRPKVAVARATGDGWRVAERDSFAGTILADAGLPPARSLDGAHLILAPQAPDRRVRADGRFERVDPAVWFGPGGVFASRAALADLKRIAGE
jgi:iron complex transport system substrate-binding protein